MKIQTSLDNGNYRKFCDLAAKEGMTEYQLAQEAILVYINSPEIGRNKSKLLAFLEWVKRDLTFENY